VHRRQGLSVRLKFALSYIAFLMMAAALLLTAAWVFLLRGRSLDIFLPSPSNLLRAFNPTNFGPVIFGAAAIVALMVLLLIGLVGGWILAGRMLAPLDRITDATRRAAAGSLSHRIRLSGSRDEFRELADAFDAMLAQLEAHVGEQRRFAANASHELRTPLAITRTLLEVARKDPAQDMGQLVERLHAVNARAIELIEALLLLSRTDQRSFTREAVDLSLIVEEAVETLLPLAEKHGVSIETADGTARTTGSRALLQQMAANLLHNAIVHNLPEQGAIWLRLRERPDCVTLTVENTGERLDPALVATLAEPFRRGSERIRAGHAGVGLGLAIVQSIARAHDGTVTLRARPSGGLCATVELPVASFTAGGQHVSPVLARPCGS
jgi:two-component system sensor histidine kinase VanS